MLFYEWAINNRKCVYSNDSCNKTQNTQNKAFYSLNSFYRLSITIGWNEQHEKPLCADLYYFYRQEEIVNEINSIAICYWIMLNCGITASLPFHCIWIHTSNATQLALLIRCKHTQHSSHILLAFFISLRISASMNWELESWNAMVSIVALGCIWNNAHQFKRGIYDSYEILFCCSLRFPLYFFG